MIHDIDLVLSMVRAPLRKIQAVGISVLGGHEDVANAQAGVRLRLRRRRSALRE